MLLEAADRGRFARGFDICVVGAGPAGIALARRLAARGLDVALMEGGGRDVSGESQDQYIGESVGLPYHELDVTRLRVLGGSSTHWGGWCRALDPHDFEPLPHRPYGWPIGKADLDPYAAAASEVLGLAAPEGPDLPITQVEDRLRNIQLRRSEARFGEVYGDEIAADPGITACLNANLVDLTLAPDLATVAAAHFRSYDPGDPGFAVKGRAYCLCLGGLENPRMLLNFTRQKPQGIGNDHDLVGRYFCEHPSYKVVDLLYARRPQFAADHFAPTLDFMRREQVLNFTARLLVHEPPPASRPAALKAAALCAAPFTERLAERVLGWRPNCRWGGLSEYDIRRDPDRYPTGHVTLYTEQLLDRDSRVRLADATDDFGLRRLRLDWRLAEMDFHTMQTALLAVGAHLAEQDIGRMRVRDWALAEHPVLPEDVGREWEGSNHHMCTTRMADDPRAGVVDRDCRVHGTANLYLGGSSVFAAPGFATPTFTIVQLALRLGDHLAGALSGTRARSGTAD